MPRVSRSVLLALLPLFAWSFRSEPSRGRALVQEDPKSSGSPSPAEAYVASDVTPDKICKPRLLRSTCEDSQYKGLVLYFHGFSACASQIDDVGPKLQNACMDVFAPTYPGHGPELVTCTSGKACTVEFEDGMGFDLSELPRRSSDYIAFVERVSEVAEEELFARAGSLKLERQKLQLDALGLSLGGSLASYAVTSHPGRFQRQLLVNPFFGMGQEGVDGNLYKCLQQVKEGTSNNTACMEGMFRDWVSGQGDQKIPLSPMTSWLLRNMFGHRQVAGVQRAVLGTLALLSDHPPGDHATTLQADLKSFMSKEQEWGDVCWKIREKSRGGFCKFTQEHLLAAHSVGTHALIQAQQVKAFADKMPVSQTILTERDGMTRNGISYAAARQQHEAAEDANHRTSVAACMYRFKNGDQSLGGPDGIMPHANLAHVDNPDPIERWWEDGLFNKVVRFLAAEVDDVKDCDADVQMGDMRNCVDLPLDRHALDNFPWLRETLAPEAAVSDMSEIQPGFLYKEVVLNFDFWARHVACPNFQEDISSFVDCSAIEAAKDTPAAQEASVPTTE
eukprot:TRINITY_DN36468_c0_g1_i1.p1 TRINITY_DN36468_c0_g1~~TRINITY_DN36468_c0_g1_i1.p1  ORF type:complete len:562 (-),score=119.94 TRINITY_DN36468_c0_g1_i1:57-1742(-)